MKRLYLPVLFVVLNFLVIYLLLRTYNEALTYIIPASIRNLRHTVLLVEISHARLSCILFVRFGYSHFKEG